MEPVAAKVEKAAVGPVAGCQEKNEEEKRAVKARSVEEVSAEEEEEDEGRRRVCRDEEERQPTVTTPAISQSLPIRAQVSSSARRRMNGAYLRRQNIVDCGGSSWPLAERISKRGSGSLVECPRRPRYKKGGKTQRIRGEEAGFVDKSTLMRQPAKPTKRRGFCVAEFATDPGGNTAQKRATFSG